jgi:steroid delta-isomerase-like uncharacterized protein
MNQLADLIQRYYDAFNRRDLAIYDRLFTPDCLIEGPGVQLHGIEGARAFDRVWHTAMPDGKINSLRKTTGERSVMCENRFRGTHAGPLVTADGALPASGRLFDEPYVAVFELDGERIQRQTLHFDRLQVMKVLGPRSNIETVQQIYAAVPKGDVQFILDQLADDVTWGIESVAAGEVPAHGILRGKANVPKFFAAWAETGEFTTFNPHDFIAAGDHVFNTLHYEFRVNATGKTVKNHACMQHWTFKDGKLARWRGHEDTAATRDAYRR